MDSAILGIAFLDEERIVSISTLGTIDFADVSQSKIIASESIEFQTDEQCSFLSRLSENTVAIGGSLGSLFFATLLKGSQTIDVVKKLHVDIDQPIRYPLLSTQWCYPNFYAVCG